MIRSMLAAALLGSVALAAPAFAADSAQPTATPAASTHKHRTAAQKAAGVEARIQELHKKLKITEAQKPQWDAFAKVMRDNATESSTLHKARMEKMAGKNAVEDLRAYQEMAQAHVDGLKRLTSSFQAVYDSMSAEQKKNADSVFDTHRARFSGSKGNHKKGA